YGFTRAILDKLAEKIDPAAMKIGEHLAREYAAGYDRLNPVFRRLYGFDMPRIRNYSPGLFEHADGRPDTPADAFGGDSGPVNAMSAGFTKARRHHTARPKQSNALAVYWQHFEQAEYFIAFS